MYHILCCGYIANVTLFCDWPANLVLVGLNEKLFAPKLPRFLRLQQGIAAWSGKIPRFAQAATVN